MGASVSKIFKEESGKFKGLSDFGLELKSDSIKGLKFDKGVKQVKKVEDAMADVAEQGIKAGNPMSAAMKEVEKSAAKAHMTTKKAGKGVKALADVTKKAGKSIKNSDAWESVEAGTKAALIRIMEHKDMMDGVAKQTSIAAEQLAKPIEATVAQPTQLRAEQRPTSTAPKPHEYKVEKLLEAIMHNTEPDEDIPEAIRLELADVAARTA